MAAKDDIAIMTSRLHLFLILSLANFLVPTRAKLTVSTETKKVEIEIGDDFSVECRANLVPVGCSIAGRLDKLG